MPCVLARITPYGVILHVKPETRVNSGKVPNHAAEIKTNVIAMQADTSGVCVIPATPVRAIQAWI